MPANKTSKGKAKKSSKQASIDSDSLDLSHSFNQNIYNPEPNSFFSQASSILCPEDPPLDKAFVGFESDKSLDENIEGIFAANKELKKDEETTGSSRPQHPIQFESENIHNRPCCMCLQDSQNSCSLL